MKKILNPIQFYSQAFCYWAKTGNIYNNYKHYLEFEKKETERLMSYPVSRRYIWKTAGDDKVRDRHESRDGEIFNWNEDGIRPGEDFNCRCLAIFIDEDNYPTGEVKRMKYNVDTGKYEEQSRDKSFISAPYGELRLNGPHSGVDFRMPEGTPIKAVKGGVVKRSKWQRDGNGNLIGYGNYVRIKNDDGTISEYGHMVDESHLKKGQRVEKGDYLGGVGSTGSSTGNHLHYTERIEDENYKNGKIIEPDNEAIVDILNNFARYYFDNILE
jgi:SPP1 gp7 family putative phage head morphogenesis protein